MPQSRPISDKRVETRQKLLNATLETMAEAGLHGLSLDAVAKRVGVTKGAIYDNFESKDDMIVAAMASLPDEALTPIVWPRGRKGSVRSRLKRLGEAVWAGKGDVARSAFGTAEFNLYALMHEDLRKRMIKISAMGPTRTKEHLLELFAPGELAMPIDAFVLFLHAVIPGLSQFRALAPRAPDKATVLAMFEVLAADNLQADKAKHAGRRATPHG